MPAPRLVFAFCLPSTLSAWGRLSLGHSALATIRLFAAPLYSFYYTPFTHLVNAILCSASAEENASALFAHAPDKNIRQQPF